MKVREIRAKTVLEKLIVIRLEVEQLRHFKFDPPTVVPNRPQS